MTNEESEAVAQRDNMVDTAKAAKLRYVSDEAPGIRRKPWGRGFTYLEPNGEVVHDPTVRQRIKDLVIPPAWQDVWICPAANGHIQVTGRDERGRKQYIYHLRWQEMRNETKFKRMILFGEALPLIRQQVDKDLRRHGLPREKVLAAVVQLLEKTLIRVGNVAYVRQNNSFGLTTLRNRHVEVSTTKVQFEFRGKSGKLHQVSLKDRRLARIIKNCQELPGYELFQYLDEEGCRHTIDSLDVNEYLREITGEAFTAKDFRTWGSTVSAMKTLYEIGPAESEGQVDKNVTQAIKAVAGLLGNTPAVCRDYYVHPAVLKAYRDGSFFEIWQDTAVREPEEGLAPEDEIVLAILRRSAGE